MTEFIKQTALEIGFDDCGIAKADFLEADARFMKTWLEKGFQGEMSYLERNFEKRTDPAKMVEGCKSIIVTLLNYFPSERQAENSPKISKYAFSKTDYHTVIKQKLLLLENEIIRQYGSDCFNNGCQHRFVDSAPVLERRWAERAGLGWIGRNKMLIHPQLGSFCFIGVLMINVELEYAEPSANRCGTCRKCLDACPTQALSYTEGLIATRCISYQTIEKKGDITPDVRAKLSGYAYGCDICNDVCPWNKTRAKANNHKELKTADEITVWDTARWENLSLAEYNHVFKDSAIRRAGYNKIKQNIFNLRKPTD